MKNAEAALRAAKRSGQKYLFYAPAMNAAVAEMLTLENKLRRAVERREFVLHFQPKYELVPNRLCGFEALIRWQDPDTGLVPPAKFIPVLEETGMIGDVGRWVVRAALAQCQAWQGAGLQPLRVAVNVSPLQLRHPDFVAHIREAIAAHGGRGDNLELEITESLVMEDIESNIRKLTAIRDLGVMVSVDDFGTGYSSLGYVSKLPINALKIDRSFIVNMTSTPEALNIVQTIISLAHSSRFKVIAEGVDSEEQTKRRNCCACCGATRCRATISASRCRQTRRRGCCSRNSPVSLNVMSAEIRNRGL